MRLDGQMTLADESPEYAEFVEKFKPKKTTDLGERREIGREERGRM